MLTIARQEIDPIAPVLQEVEPGVDTSQMGSWGILYLVCGALAGQSFRWKATVFENIPSGYGAFQQWLSGKPSEMDLAFGFKDLLFKWTQDPMGKVIAHQRLNTFGRENRMAVSSQGREHLENYFGLAIALNSYSELECEEINAIRRWANEHEQGWATLFFAAGILLSGEQGFPWPSIGEGLIMVSHLARGKVKALLDQYPRRR